MLGSLTSDPTTKSLAVWPESAAESLSGRAGAEHSTQLMPWQMVQSACNESLEILARADQVGFVQKAFCKKLAKMAIVLRLTHLGVFGLYASFPLKSFRIASLFGSTWFPFFSRMAELTGIRPLSGHYPATLCQRGPGACSRIVGWRHHFSGRAPIKVCQAVFKAQHRLARRPRIDTPVGVGSPHLPRY